MQTRKTSKKNAITCTIGPFQNKLGHANKVLSCIKLNVQPVFWHWKSRIASIVQFRSRLQSFFLSKIDGSRLIKENEKTHRKKSH